MAEITVKNAAGKDAGTVDLDDATFGIQPNVPVMHQVVTAQLAARRAGTQSTKTRSEVRGGGAKPYRQKGTGNARQGSIRSPQFSGGGVALGPKPRSYGKRTPKKMIGLALRSALSDRANEGKVVVVDDWGWETPSTKSAKQALAALGIDGKALVVLGRDDASAALSFRNLPEVQLIAPAELNAYDVLCNDVIVFTKASLPVATKQPTIAEQAAAVAETVTETVADAVETVADKAAGVAADAAQAVADVAQSAADALTDDQTTDTDSSSTTVDAQPAEASASDEADGGSGRSEAPASPDPEEESQ